MEKGKTYRIKINKEEDSKSGILRNSFVMQPAVDLPQVDGSYFAFSKTQNLLFKKDKSEQMFMSVSLLADYPIERVNKDGEPYYVIFTKEDIKEIVKKFMGSENIHDVSYNHIPGSKVPDIKLVESFFLDKDRINTNLFKGITEGSWITSYYVKDKKLYDLLLDDEQFNGFSVEIDAFLEPYDQEEFAEQKIKEIIFSSELSDLEKEQEIKKLLEL
jgi:hypothetical protein